MATEFSIGVIIGGAISGAFRSAMSGTRRTLDSLGDVSRQLTERQNTLTRAVERYGQVGSRSAQRLNADLQRVGRTLDQLQQQQKRLQSAAAMSDSAKANRMALYGQGVETYAMARTAASPIMGAVQQYASFESGLRDISVTGNLTRDQEKKIGTKLRQAAKDTNQLHETIMEGQNTLVAAGMEPMKASDRMNLVGRTATASKGNINDLAKMGLAFETLDIKDDKGMKEAFNRALAGSKAGRFELKDLSQYFPELAAAFKAKGIVGQEAVSQIIASLEVGRESAGTEGEAATNMRNWLAAMNRSDTIHKYEKAGINYQASMKDYVANGYSQYEASLMIADRFIKGKGDKFLKEWEKAGKQGDKETQQKLMESFGMSEIFTDIQTVNHLIAMRQRWDDYKKIKAEMSSDEAQGAIDKDFDSQNDTLEAQYRRSKIAMNDSAIGLGESLRPALISVSSAITPLIDQLGQWISQNPVLVKNIVIGAAGLLAFKAGVIGARLGMNLLLSPIVNTYKGIMLLHSKWTLLRLAFSAGGRARQWISVFGNLAKGALNLGRSLAGGLWSGIQLAGRGLLWMGNGIVTVGRFFGGAIVSGIRMVAAGLGWLGRTSLLLGRVLGGTLLRGITLVSRAILIMGRTMLMTPIGIVITLIAGSAYLIYRYWEPISNWFKQRWADITTAFSGGISGVTRLILDWSPVGLFYRVFAGVMKYFGIDIPAKFSEFGGNIISGFVNGIRNKWEEAKAGVGELGDNIKGWFAEKLGIHSPSRVFMGFGDNIAQGAAIGISRSTPLAAAAGQRLATELTPDMPKLPAAAQSFDPANLRRGNNAASGTASAPGIQVSFSPTININGQPQNGSSPDIARALNLSLNELEKMLQRIVAEQQRRGYA
ncbi:phage tail tape measure protein [Dickeya undicola]|uniref:Phage tail tape measure protein n=1 Tax=Dickeya undicola TaxID=1577887 RepID=A0A3N0FPM2_9GAMM|nr:phage tail tape measure protein [Dickeya undicola]RNM02094.1 phage tail tape measure protein [Dickeya undicola]